jgi:hypothetical protein
LPEPASADFSALICALEDARVDFVVVGGIAAILHGAAYQTNDLDISYARDEANIKKLAAFLKKVHARLRGAPPDLPFRPDEPTLKAGLNFTFRTDSGDLDLLGELDGLGRHDRVLAGSIVVDLYGRRVRVLDLDGLILTKRAAGRPKDQLSLPELEALSALRKRDS